MRKLSLLVFIGILAFLTACTSSTVLNERRARGLIQDTLPGYFTSTVSFKPFMGRSREDWTIPVEDSEVAFILKKLIEQKLVFQKPIVINYPMISGRFVSGSSVMQVQMEPNSNMVAGTCSGIDFVSTARTGPLRGTVTADGHGEWIISHLFCTGYGKQFLYTEVGSIARVALLAEPNRAITAGGELTGTASRKRLELQWCDYTFSPVLQPTPFESSIFVKAGKYEVEEV